MRVRAFTDNVAGVKLPRFEHRLVGVENAKAEMTGLGSGGKQLQNCKKAYLEAVELLVELAGLQTAFITLDIAIKTTSRRVNALENVVTPRLENTVQYIKGELDELDEGRPCGTREWLHAGVSSQAEVVVGRLFSDVGHVEHG